MRPGREADYEAWLARLVEATSSMSGFLGARLQRPRPGEAPTYTSVFRFASIDTLRAFEQSDLRREALAEVADLVEADALWSRLTGLELWFSPPPGTVAPQPSRFRMALVMVVVVYGLVVSIGQLVAVLLGDAPAQLRLLLTWPWANAHLWGWKRPWPRPPYRSGPLRPTP